MKANHKLAKASSKVNVNASANAKPSITTQAKNLLNKDKEKTQNTVSTVKDKVKAVQMDNRGSVDLKAFSKSGKRYSPGKPTQGFSCKGYNPQQGERTFGGYVKNNVSVNAELNLYTNLAGFRNNNGNIGADFKRFGSNPHGGISPHVHQPYRNVNPRTGDIFGGAN